MWELPKSWKTQTLAAADKYFFFMTIEQAINASEFFHKTLTYTDNKTPIRVRRNGKTKLWKKQPERFSIPVKYGLKDCFRIDNTNCEEWTC